MLLLEHDELVQALPAKRIDEPLYIAVPP